MDGSLARADAGANAFVPGICVTAVARVPYGSHPCGGESPYGRDTARLRE